MSEDSNIEKEVRGPGASRRPASSAASIAAIVALGIALYLPGIRWGIPGLVSWSQDTIAGFRTLGAVEDWPHDWKGRYPPLHYLILRAAYEPVLRHWNATAQRTIDPVSGKAELALPHPPKVGTLFLVAGLVSAAMAIAAGVGLRAAALHFTNRSDVGLAAATFLMIGADFTFFAHLGNVDVPSICWFCWGLYFYARLLRSRGRIDAFFLGLFTAAATSTKDAVGAAYIGMAIVLWMTEAFDQYDRAREGLGKAAWRTLCVSRWWIGLAAFAAPYFFANGVFVNLEGFAGRIRYWAGLSSGDTLLRELRHEDYFALGVETVRQSASGIGWPMLAALIPALVYALRCHTRITLQCLVPAVAYYLIIIAPSRFVYARFLFPMFALAAIPFGMAAIAFLRNARIPLAARFVTTTLVLVPTIAYACAVDAEMNRDTRYAAEDWFRHNVPHETSVGAVTHADIRRFKAQYLPRVHEMGYSTYPVPAAADAMRRPQPDYLILSQYDYEDFDETERKVADQLLAGEFDYVIAARFERTILGTGRSRLGMAGWSAPPPGKISPTITILRRRADSGP